MVSKPVGGCSRRNISTFSSCCRRDVGPTDSGSMTPARRALVLLSGLGPSRKWLKPNRRLLRTPDGLPRRSFVTWKTCSGAAFVWPPGTITIEWRCFKRGQALTNTACVWRRSTRAPSRECSTTPRSGTISRASWRRTSFSFTSLSTVSLWSYHIWTLKSFWLVESWWDRTVTFKFVSPFVVRILKIRTSSFNLEKIFQFISQFVVWIW